MTPSELQLRGQLLYGRQWQGDLARNVGVSRWTVTEWKLGRAKIKPSIEKKIEELMARRARMLRSMISENSTKKTENRSKTTLMCEVF